MHGRTKNLKTFETYNKKKSNTKTISTDWFLILNVLGKDKKGTKLFLPKQNMESNAHLKKAKSKYY